MATRRKSMSIAEEDAFLLTFDELIDEIVTFSSYEDMEETIEWLKRVICYNVPGGKQIRGRGVVAAYRAIVDEPKNDDIKQTYIMGWCIEIFQACFLMADDMIDNSETRRGNVCWYLVDKIGDLAINDLFLLMGVMYFFLDRFCFEKPYYEDLIGLFHDVCLKTSLGQCLDIQTSKQHNLAEFTMKNYKKINQYKTCYYSFYLPVACAMVMAKKTNVEDWKAVEELVLEIGLLFQVQYDFLDCYGNTKVTGKTGMNIPENKCSWLIVKAIENSNAAQQKILKRNYGRGKESTPINEQKIKALFDELKIPDEYKKFEEETYASILQKIEKLSDRLPTQIFLETAEVIFRRNK